MRKLEKPKVYMVARPQVYWDAVATFLQEEYGLKLHNGAWVRGQYDSDPEMLCELMGRLCYGSFGPRQGRVGAREYISHILASGHGSVLEHACWSFIVCRASRGFTHQMVRHRAGFGFSQESSHYVRYGEEAGQEPSVCTLGVPVSSLEAFVEACEHSYAMYNLAYTNARESGLKHKQACAAVRGLVPTAAESRLGFTANARALRHFVELRGQEDNVPEIRHVAAQVADLLIADAPAIFGDVTVGIGADGHPTVSSAHRKV